MDKPGGFIGRDALLRALAGGRKRALVQFLLGDSQTMLYRNEPIWRDGALAGYVSSGMYGHTLGAAVGLGYVSCAGAATQESISAARYEIEVAGARVPATASLVPMYDPSGARVRA
jgi:4-methylaminobutanoate oxidase (formaldehyde-forming)